MDSRALLRQFASFWTGPRMLTTGVLVGVGAGGVRFAARGDLATAVAWVAAIVVSMIGWGEIINAWIAPKRIADWALRAVWGMGLFVLLGGVFTALHVTSHRMVSAQVVVGLLIFAVRRILHPFEVPRRRTFALLFANAGVYFVIFFAYAIAALTVVSMAGVNSFQPSDDLGPYFLLVRKVLEQGSLYDPFDVRRLSTFGGQTYLQATFAAVSPMFYMNMLDSGAFGVVVVGLIVGAFTTRGLRPAHVVPLGAGLALYVFLLGVRLNTTSLYTGVAAYLGIYRTLHFSPTRGVDRRPTWPIDPRLLVVIALLTVTCYVLRTSNVVAVCTFVGVLLLSAYFSGARAPLSRDSLRSFGLMALAFAVSFVIVQLPWSILMRESCGTYFYPLLGRGWLTPGFVFLKPVEGVKEAADALVANLFFDRPLAAMPIFLVAGLSLVPGRWRYSLMAMTLGTIIGGLVMILTGHHFTPAPLARYYFPYLVGTAFAVVISVGQRPTKLAQPLAWARDALILGAVAYHVGASREAVKQQFAELVKNADHAYYDGPAELVVWNEKSRTYLALQSRMDPAARVAVAVEEPFRFDMRRNRILSLDIPGGMGPKQGFPVFQGPDGLEDYLRSYRIRYLVIVDFNRANELYNRAHWQSHLHWTGTYLQAQAPFLLDVEANLDTIASRHAQPYRTDTMTLVDLEN